MDDSDDDSSYDNEDEGNDGSSYSNEDEGNDGSTYANDTDFDNSVNGNWSGVWDTDTGTGTSWNADMTESAPYGTYSAWDYDTFGYGDPTVGNQNTPQEAAEAYQAMAEAQQAQAFQSMLDTWAITPDVDPEAQFQATQDLNNYAVSTDYSKGASPEAISEYNSLGLSGAINGYTYTDLNGQTNVNYGSIGNTALSALANAGTIAGALTGYGELGTVLSGISNAVLGNIGSVTGLLGSLFGGTYGSALGSIAGNLATGKDETAAKSAVSAGLSTAGLSLGSMLNNSLGLTDMYSELAATLAGNYAQSKGIDAALNYAGVSNNGAFSSALGDMLSAGNDTNEYGTDNEGEYLYG